ncbi:MAG: LytTR family DNA-binding domain-containing protein [Saprospiraceae bacterium]
MTRYRAVLIDDEQHCLDTLQNDLARYCPDIEVIQTFHSSEKAKDWLLAHPADVLFLDIVMPGLTGFQLLEALAPDTFHVIFTTAYSEYAIKALRLSAVDYLEKPVDKDELIAAVVRLRERAGGKMVPQQLNTLIHNLEKNNKTKRIGLPDRSGYEFFEAGDILYCEADGNYCTVYFSDGGKRVITRSLKDMEEMLDDVPFCRIHHGVLINLNQVKRYLKGDGGSVEMTNGVSLPVSRNKKEEFLRHWRV